MWDKIWPILLGTFLSGVIGAVIYFAKSYFDDIKADNKATKLYVDSEITKLKTEINDLKSKYSSVFNDLLEKFSKWEDRIKKIMDDYIREAQALEKSVAQNTRPESKADDSALKELDAIMKKEFKNIFNEISEVENDIKQIEINVKLISNKEKRNEQVINDVKTILQRMTSELGAIKNNSEKNNEITIDKIKMMYKVCKGLNDEYNKLLKRMDLLQELTKNRIVLHDKK